MILLATFGLAANGCATKQSVDALRSELSKARQENFQLRKDLAEARVRSEMQKEGTSGTAETIPLEPPSVASRNSVAPAKDSGSRIIYSEPITDATRLPAVAGGSPAGSRGADRLMRSARESLDAKDPSGAMMTFRQILTGFPDNALADDAQFGVGECYFQMGRYEEAIAEYRKVVNDFPFGDQVPFAFLKIGFAHLAREQRDLALENFKTVSEAYPGTEAATVARQQIAHLKASRR